jgi:hypothetical protein
MSPQHVAVEGAVHSQPSVFAPGSTLLQSRRPLAHVYWQAAFEPLVEPGQMPAEQQSAVVWLGPVGAQATVHAPQLDVVLRLPQPESNGASSKGGPSHTKVSAIDESFMPLSVPLLLPAPLLLPLVLLLSAPELLPELDEESAWVVSPPEEVSLPVSPPMELSRVIDPESPQFGAFGHPFSWMPSRPAMDAHPATEASDHKTTALRLTRPTREQYREIRVRKVCATAPRPFWRQTARRRTSRG